MAESSAALLGEIETAALDEDVPVAVALRKCLVLGGRANSEALRDWALKELNGYSSDEELPEYRVLCCALLIDGFSGSAQIKGQRISSLSLPEQARDHISETVRFTDGIAKIENMAKEARAKDGFVNMSPKGSAELAVIMSAKTGSTFSRVSDIYWSVSGFDLQGIVDRVRTTCTELVAVLRSSQPDDNHDPKPEAVRQAVTMIFAGKARVKNVNTNQAAASSQAKIEEPHAENDDSPTWYATKKFWGFLVGLAGIIVAVAAVATWAPWK